MSSPRCVVDQLELAGSLHVRFPALVAIGSVSKEVGPGYNHEIREHLWDLVWGSNTTVGTAIVESAPYPGYTGTWSEIASVAWSAASRVDRVQHTGRLGTTRVRLSVGSDGLGLTIKFSGYGG